METRKSAKLLCAGPIPARTSNYTLTNNCPSGVIGSRARLKIVFPKKECGFDAHLGH